MDNDGSSCSFGYKLGLKTTVVADGNPLTTHVCIRGDVDSEKFDEIFGEPKIIEQPNEPSSNESTESFWSTIWNKITSFFS
jgi:hypothetical protein